MNYLAIILVIVIAIILYYLYYFITNNELTSGLQSIQKQTMVPYSKLTNPNTYTYSYQCWLYISSPPTSEQRLFYRSTGDASDNSCFQVDMCGQEMSLKAGSGSTPLTKVMTITTEFPVQRWTYLVINVYNLQTFEVYINGKLVKTVNVQSSNSPKPVSNRNNLYIGGSSGLSGYVTKFTRTEKTMDAKNVWDNYLSGNGLSNLFGNLIPYGLNISISKGEELQRSIKLL